MPAIQIRAFAEGDWPQVWSIIREIIRAGDTYAYDPAMTEVEARAIWIEAPRRTVVALDGERILGAAKMGPNRPGPGSHISNASFMVSVDARGRGVGTALCRYALEWAQQSGYAGMQFNAVAESNRAAIAVYERLGFTIVGTVPGAFAHPTLGRVALHIMYRALEQRL